MIQAIGLFVALIAAIAFELWGVHRKHGGWTYTGVVQWIESRKGGVGLFAKALVLAFSVSLPFHFLLGWGLLP